MFYLVIIFILTRLIFATCLRAKQKCLPFILNHNMSKFPFDIIHCDVWGPIVFFTLHDQRLFLTLVDDCARFTRVFLIRHKYKVPAIVARFCTMVETHFGDKAKAIRSDTARELAFSELCQQKGFYINILVCNVLNRIRF